MRNIPSHPAQANTQTPSTESIDGKFTNGYLLPVRITWASDIHLEFCREDDRERFFYRLAGSPGDAILLTGDIASHNRTARMLEEMHTATGKPIYYVTGNHDFYGGAIQEVTSALDGLRARVPDIVRLDTAGPIQIARDTGLVGHGGWACGTAGSGINTNVRINDEVYIPDLRWLTKEKLFAQMRLMAKQSADHIRAVGAQAAEAYANVWIATHVPPFAESCTYDNRLSEPDYLPHFCNLLLGDVIQQLASAFPDTRFTVLCGHTHGAAFFSPAPNLRVITAAAEYRCPSIRAELDPEAEAQKAIEAWQQPPHSPAP